jgi:hypothetical protein
MYEINFAIYNHELVVRFYQKYIYFFFLEQVLFHVKGQVSNK